MYSFMIGLVALAPLAFAAPAAKKGWQATTTFGDTSQILDPDLAARWYDDWWYENNNTAPQNPKGFYRCTGPDMSAFPAKSEWLSFKTLWELNKQEMDVANGNDGYVQNIQDAIKEISQASKIDSRILLAMMMQESTGKVHAACTGGGGNNDCGLIQIGGGRRFDASNPKQSIHDMVSDAVYGVPKRAGLEYARPGILQYFNGGSADLNWIPEQYWGNPYAAMHLYNSGKMSSTKLNTQDAAPISKAYSFDVVSRLLGWTGGIEGCKASARCEGLNLRLEKDCW